MRDGGPSMGKAARSGIATILVFGAVLLLALTPLPSAVVALTATALYLGGTGHPLSIPEDTTEFITQYIDKAGSLYVSPSGLCGGVCSPAAVYSPEQFRFDTGFWDLPYDESVAIGLANLDACLRKKPCTVTKPPYTVTDTATLTDASYVVFGYSQSAGIAALEKYDLIAHPPPGTTVSFVLNANPNRPNGGILERFVGWYLPVIGVTFNGAMTTNSPEPHPITTVDVANQYEPVADFPTNPLNLLADLNVLVGFLYLHPETAYFAATDIRLQGRYQDTTYYLAPAKTVPLLMPLEQIPLIGPALAATLDPPLRVLIEAGYDRTINPGQPTPAQWLYVPDLLKTTVNFLKAIPTGWDNGIALLTGDPANRPFHTTPPGPYGVGGPPVYAGAIDPYGDPTPLTPTPSPVASTRTAATATVARPARSKRAAPARPSRTATAPRAHGTSHTGASGRHRAPSQAD